MPNGYWGCVTVVVPIIVIYFLRLPAKEGNMTGHNLFK